jgi:hypothetical protein
MTYRNGEAEVVDEVARGRADTAQKTALSAYEAAGGILRELHGLREEMHDGFARLERRISGTPTDPPRPTTSARPPLPSLSELEPDEITVTGRTPKFHLMDTRGNRIATVGAEDLSALRTGKVVRRGAWWAIEKLGAHAFTAIAGAVLYYLWVELLSKLLHR